MLHFHFHFFSFFIYATYISTSYEHVHVEVRSVSELSYRVVCSCLLGCSRQVQPDELYLDSVSVHDELPSSRLSQD